ncbi:MAG: flagellar hook-associated protein FlgL [Betaproteobacteria bacterium]|nr:flagellar hook-associated protein FlgL [Betaproteobacteria bacterium]
MRLSTSQIYQAASSVINQRQADLSRLQGKLASGKRIDDPADDPAGAAVASLVRSNLSANEQFGQNRDVAIQRLSITEAALGNVVDNLQSIREVLVAAGNASYTNDNRKVLATQLRESLDSLVNLANSKDGTGGYLFSGYLDHSAPFVRNGLSVSYVGDEGSRVVNVAAGRTINAGVNGAEVFQRSLNGNGLVATSAGATNTGTGVIDNGTITSVTALTGYTYSVQFQTTPTGLTYDVVDTTNSTTVSTGTPYVSPAIISVPGFSVPIQGTPANGDTFTIAPSTSRDVFSIISSAITLLETPVTTTAAPLDNGLRVALADIDRAFGQVTLNRSIVGARLAEIDLVSEASDTTDLTQRKTLGKIEDTDYAATVSEYSANQTALQAALATYSKMAKLSLFDYI